MPWQEIWSYLSWQWKKSGRSDQPVRELLRAVWSPSLHRSIPTQLGHIIKRAEEIGLQLGWIRFSTDGTRLQVFDPHAGRIGKVHKDDLSHNTIPSEIKVRAHAAVLAPAIFKVASDLRAFSEEWLLGDRLPYSLDTLIEAIGKLKSYVYSVECVEAVEFRKLIAEWDVGIGPWECLLENLLAEWPGRSLPLSQVHGDLVVANLWYHPGRGIILIDWEYSRRCLVTHDIWFYIYHHHRSQDRQSPLTKTFFNDLHYVLIRCGFGFLADRIPVIHGLHLIERLILLKAVTPFAHHSIKMIESDLLELSRKRLDTPRNSRDSAN